METANYYVHSDLLDSFLNEIKNIRNRCIIFYFSFGNMTPDNGKKIKKIVDFIEREDLGLFLSFVPLCVFRPNKKHRNFFLKHEEVPVFVSDSLGITQLLTKESKNIISLGTLCKKCVNCHYRVNGKCGGIYVKKSRELKSPKVREWYLEHLENLKEGKILDLGSGTIPYLDVYEKLLSKNHELMFACLDPFKLAIRVLEKRIKTRDKITQVCGFGEDIPFRKNLFDVVFMKSSYSHFFNLEKVLENVHKSLKSNGRFVIFEERSPVIKKADFWMKHHRDHALKEAILEIKKHRFRVLESFEYGGMWGVLATPEKFVA